MSETIVLPHLSGGGSNRGLGYWFSWTKCPYRYSVEQARKDEHDDDDSSAAGIGTYYHQLLEYYRLGRLPGEVAISHEAGLHNYDFIEALRLFKGYRARFAADEFEYVGVELEEEATGEQSMQTFGVPEYSVKYDAVVRVSAEDVHTIRGRRRLPHLDPGLYLLDTKSRSQKPSDTQVDAYKYTPQFIAYPMMWDLLHPDEPCKGMLVDTAIRHKKLTDDSYRTYLVPPPNLHQRKYLQAMLRTCYEYSLLFSSDTKNPLACHDRWGTCPLWESGECDGGVTE